MLEFESKFEFTYLAYICDEGIWFALYMYVDVHTPILNQCANLSSDAPTRWFIM